MTQPIVVRTKTFSARTVLRRNRNIVDILPWKTPFWKIKPKSVFVRNWLNKTVAPIAAFSDEIVPISGAKLFYGT